MRFVCNNCPSHALLIFRGGLAIVRKIVHA
ncbi:hypothetical protein MANES_04G076355v8 [Manihot esculenta]|uniref:Uncharacterized protein n=1 Tax=Manihot esculenta TaxID=3983 RepID=A0ACB7HT12_MANES|nr:hypothetical protein MANES_04G076355v8 [Manihot esculenta]